LSKARWSRPGLCSSHHSERTRQEQRQIWLVCDDATRQPRKALSVTSIPSGIATETSIGRLFIAGVMPGLVLTGMFIIWTVFAIWRKGFRSHAEGFRYSWKQKLVSIPKVVPC
jgi:hypothetical protein